ncbi:N-acetylmuramic acid 6-phosphate etherase [Acidipropionibacterium acidipropionici]|uniref:N-acetylmuramic acid 6-phosphate etherase n=1 Tax=Acidipropionibacterium acidipropionici TaxID=1748 RepID=A0AAC8YIG0_9ACTN|nr:N-acetylmuramic acid 6-phosphate etherase [Acidipropionibacterium acidipropionici]AOZ48391.1 N-acetylmuramic acid 6-phosphate etherase [Acidipropionibacterium acidipropionici]AZP39252.1 N-acetylmuramic acid 6-phosphate etherase [Acidipropionibacterium acidipropionici]
MQEETGVTPTSRAPSQARLSWPTETRNERTFDIDQLDAEGVVTEILGEDARVAAAVQACTGQIARVVDLYVSALAAGGTVHYVGAGTSGRLGVLDAVELLPTYGIRPDQVIGHMAGGEKAFVRAVEGAEDSEALGAAELAQAGPHDVVIGIAASGRTPYVAGALTEARRRGLPTALISTNPQAPLAGLADVAILPDTGPEAVTGSTRMKSGTAQKMVLNAISTAAMVRLGKTWSNLMVDVVATNEKLHHRMVRIVEQATGASPESAAEALTRSDGRVRVAIVALEAGVDVDRAEAALVDFPPDPRREGDPSGLRTAADAAAGGKYDAVTEIRGDLRGGRNR